jgi:hypothetical protein
MFFAIDPCDLDTERARLLEFVTKSPALNWFALLDSAFDYKSTTKWSTPGAITIYRQLDVEKLSAASPLLIALDTQNTAHLAEQFDALLEHCNGRPMLSFIASTGDAESILKKWDRLHYVRTEDDQRFLLRFADTRSLESLPYCLTTNHWAALFEPLSDWIAPDRAGKFRALPKPQRAAKPEAPEQLSNDTLGRLIRENRPDALISLWEKKRPELLPETGYSGFFEFLRRTCYNIDDDASMGEVHSHCVEALEAVAASGGAR